MAQSIKLTHKNVKEMAKHDPFRDKTLETVQYVSGHRTQIVKYGAAVVAVLVLAGGTWLYRDSQHTARVNALNDAFKVYGSTVVPAGDPPPFATSWFRTKDEQAAAIHKAFAGVADKFGNSDESMIAHYYLGVIAGDDGKMDEAEKQFKIVADNASRDYASLGKLSLAQIYKSNGKIEDGRKLIQSLIDNPTTFVSKEQATVEMARLLEQSKPEEARKLLEPLRTSVRPAVSQSAIGALGELMQPQQQPQK